MRISLWGSLPLYHLRPVLQRLGKIRDGARQLEDAVVAACAQVHLLHGRLHQIGACLARFAAVGSFLRATARIHRPYKHLSDSKTLYGAQDPVFQFDN
jgi:hypothetical protein